MSTPPSTASTASATTTPTTNIPTTTPTNNKIKRLPTQVFVGAYQGVTAAYEIERLITNEEWDSHSVICRNMAIATKDIAGRTKIRELGNPAALEAAASGAILGGLIGSMSQLMIGTYPDSTRRRGSVIAIANDTSLVEDEKKMYASKRPSIIAKVAAHNIVSMDSTRLKKIGDALIPGSSAIICVFDEVLVKESDYEKNMKDHQREMTDLTDHVVNKIHEQLRDGNDIAFHIVLDEDTGDVSWTRTVIGDDAIQVRDIVMSHDSLALEEVTTSEDEVVTETVFITPESIATARTLLRDSVCAYEIAYEDLLEGDEDDEEGTGSKKKTYETGIVHENKDGTRDAIYEKATINGSTGEATYEKKVKIGNVNAIGNAIGEKEEKVPFDEVVG
jgi:hypothetical protein